MRGFRNVCLVNTGIDPSPPPTTKIHKLSDQHSVLGHHWPASKTPGPLPLNQQSGSAYAIFKHYSKSMLTFISLRVLQEEMFLSTQAFELMCSPRHFKNNERQL